MCIRDSNNILKLDTVNVDYINKVDRPTGHYDVNEIIEEMKAFKAVSYTHLDVYKRQSFLYFGRCPHTVTNNAFHILLSNHV